MTSTTRSKASKLLEWIPVAVGKLNERPELASVEASVYMHTGSRNRKWLPSDGVPALSHLLCPPPPHILLQPVPFDFLHVLTAHRVGDVVVIEQASVGYLKSFAPFRAEEYPSKLQEKAVLEAHYSSLQTKLRLSGRAAYEKMHTSPPPNLNVALERTLEGEH